MNDLHVCELSHSKRCRPRTIADRGDALPGFGGKFITTVAGMGRTGIVLQAKIRMTRTETAYFIADHDRTHNLDETMELLTGGSDEGYDHSMAMPDTISRGARMGRGAFTRGSLATIDQLPPKLRRDPLRFNAPQLFSMPDIFPNGLVNGFTSRVAAEVAYHIYPKHGRGTIQNLTQFYHPLDLLREWNRAYGQQGFVQYQFSIPFGAEQQLAETIRAIAHSGHRSFLNVFKRMGDGNRAPLSWRHPGFMLSLDFPIKPGIGAFLDSLDERVRDAGGRLYFAKDPRAKAHHIPQMYPRLNEWRTTRAKADRDGVFMSDLARRLELVPA
jgi:decaprenylphospho-beta-D-ribofuranose 2-oxidase